MSDLSNEFRVYGGSTPGFHHFVNGQNNQDAYTIIKTPNIIIGIVCDGCGGTPYAEVGARIGSNIIPQTILEKYLMKEKYLMEECREGPIWTANQNQNFWLEVRSSVLFKMEDIITRYFLGDISNVVFDYFLFTFVGFAITQETTCIFSLGDGIYSLNGEMTRIGPFQQNAPPYIGHQFLKKGLGYNRGIFIEKVIDTNFVKNIMVGTDGCLDLIKAQDKNLPGKSEKLVGPISQFWEEPKFINNSESVNRRLTMIGRVTQTIDWDAKLANKSKALLDDDTTLVIVRRKGCL